jgi:GNAT superfamily N-acetyltransferase
MFLTRIDASGREQPLALAEETLIREGERLHRELRPDLHANYPAQLRAMFEEGARLTQLVDANEVRALAVWRIYHTTYAGKRLYVDDLVSTEMHRSKGYGRTLLGWIEQHAAAAGCQTLALDSGTHRTRAHRFYFRQGMFITSFHFAKKLAP